MKESRFRWMAVPLFALALVAGGCAKSESETAEGGSNGGAAAAPARRAAQPAARPAPQPVVISAGTPIEVRLITGLASDKNKPGDTFSGTVEAPVTVDGRTVIPRGAEVSGRVTQAVASGRLRTPAELWVTVTSVSFGGRTYDVNTSTTGHKEGSKATRDIIFIGGGAGGGAAIGGAAGGGKGAAIGAAIGAGAGTVAAALTGKKNIEFPPETVLRFQFEQDLRVQP
jgi:hypothetical protein